MSEETLYDRVIRQVESGKIDAHLLLSDDKRRRALEKQLDKPIAESGWRKFASAAAHTIVNGKAKQARNAEAQLVEAITRWYDDVQELLPARLPELRLIVEYALRHPQQLPPKEGAR